LCSITTIVLPASRACCAAAAFYTRDGVLVASTAQEGMARVRL
jgi:acyl-CoA thioesterase